MFAPGLLLKMPFQEVFLAALIAFVINYAAYFAEIYRGGILAIPKGQYEAGQVLGMSRMQVNRLVVLPQVVKRITPAMSNEVITLVKDTSLASVIGLAEVMMTAQKIVSTRALLWPLFYTGVFYLVMVGVLTLFFKWLEKKMNYYKA
jgi:polar amino acid transport system permease protein